MASQEASTKLSKGRESQKNRTRKALVAAAGELLRAGRQASVTDAAEAAGISRATAYRYFSTQEMLLAEVALFAAGGPLFPAVSEGVPVSDAVGNLVRRVGVWTYANEQPLRTLLRLALDPSTGVRRPGNRIEWIADALAPARKHIDPEIYRRLSKALTLMLGIDPIVVMKDIAGASREQALDALEWSARTLVEAALSESASMPPTRRRTPSRSSLKRSGTSKGEFESTRVGQALRLRRARGPAPPCCKRAA